jgi:hypothetical protein
MISDGLPVTGFIVGAFSYLQIPKAWPLLEFFLELLSIRLNLIKIFGLGRLKIPINAVTMVRVDMCIWPSSPTTLIPQRFAGKIIFNGFCDGILTNKRTFKTKYA